MNETKIRRFIAEAALALAEKNGDIEMANEARKILLELNEDVQP